MSSELDAVLDAARRRARESGLAYFGAVTPEEAGTLLRVWSGARLVDVRTDAEWEYVGHVPGSALVEWNTYPNGERNPRFAEDLAAAVPDPDTPLLFLCRSGQRSSAAAAAATRAGYKHALNVLEGFEGPKDDAGHRGTVGGWRKAGLPWEQG